MLYSTTKPRTTPLSALLSFPKLYRALAIAITLFLFLYFVPLLWDSEIYTPEWYQNYGETNAPEHKASKHKGSGHETSENSDPIDADRRFALILSATKSNPNACKTIFSALSLGYPSPVIINWGVKFQDITHSEFGKALPKLFGFVDYLDSVMHPNATESEKLKEDDIVLMVDAFDVWFQLPAEVLLSRYHEINRRANERLQKEWKRTDKPMPMKQTIVLASEKHCYPNDPKKFGVDMKCDIWPQSPLRTDLYGPETDGNYSFHHTNRPRWLNGGMYIGPAGDMRRLFRRAKQRVEAMVGEAFVVRSEQGMIGQALGEQEVWRQLQRKGAITDELDDLVGENLEFHVGIDYGQDLCVESSDTAIRKPDDLFDGDFVHLNDQEDIDYRSEVRSISPVRVQGVPDDLRSVQSPLFEDGKPVDWGNMSLYTDFFLATTPVMLHHNKYKDRRTSWWTRPWYSGHLRRLASAALLPRRSAKPLATVDIEQGRIRYWAASAESVDRYPRLVQINTNLTAYERFPSANINETCDWPEEVKDNHKKTWEQEVFRDDEGAFIVNTL
ncbi:hypothetical protein FLONG3_10587 [Fusarium longipes]|uniref:Uncharacterized protein n=1 Tax=Fusarium longipes TaxID=694270 RepID=A0A395RMC6_9HYPO|nr:hypothetical protein FLONG3_10587 [Fusarium longipes]